MAGQDIAMTAGGVPATQGRNELARSASRLALLACLGSAAAGFSATVAQADCANAGGSNYLCSGANAIPQEINAPDAAVTTAPGFSVTVDHNDPALYIHGAGNISYIDTNASILANSGTGEGLYIASTATAEPGSVTVETNGAISGGLGGIRALNLGVGAIAVDVAGTVTGTTDFGVRVFNDSDATNMTVTTAEASEVIGGGFGIDAMHMGTGEATITVRGTVSGVRQAGVAAINWINATDLTVETVEGSEVTGGADGISVVNDGTGATSVTAGGSVTGTDLYGIYAVNRANTTDLTVETEAGTEVTGGRTGIRAENQGMGETRVIAGGYVEGDEAYGILTVNGVVTVGDDGLVGNVAAPNGATDLTVETLAGSEVSGGRTGIHAQNEGTGETRVTAGGVVTGRMDGYGIRAENGASATDLTIETLAGSEVSGYQHGIIALNNGTGSTTITIGGTVAGNETFDFGVYAINSASATDLTVGTTEGSEVTGGTAGIVATNSGTGETSVTAGGKVTGTFYYGIQAINGATATDLAVGTAEGSEVTGGRNGISARNIGTGATGIVAAGTVTGIGEHGIDAFNGANATDLTVETLAGSVVSGGMTGVRVWNEGMGATSVVAGGAVTGTESFGIQAINEATATDLTVETLADSEVSGGVAGIFTRNSGTGATSVVTGGTVTGAELGIDAWNNATATDLTIETKEASEVIGGMTGIFAWNRGTGVTKLTAAGTVSGTSEHGIYAWNNATATDLTVESTDSSQVTGAVEGIRALNDGTGATRVTAGGVVRGADTIGIHAENGATATDLTIEALADSEVSGGNSGIDVRNNGTGSTMISAAGTVTGIGSSGIVAENGGTATDLTVETLAGSVVAGNTNGIFAVNTGTGATRVTAGGAVTGAGSIGIFALSGSTTTDLTVETLAGSEVRGGVTGIFVQNIGTGATGITTAGTITGTERYGIFAYNHVTTTGGLTVDAQDVSGGLAGIAAANSGAGETVVTAGHVESTGESGIGILVTNAVVDPDGFTVDPLSEAFNGAQNPTATDVSVEAGSVTANFAGILATNRGTGDTEIAVGGPVTAGLVGIYAVNMDTAGALTVATDDVTAAGTGIYAGNVGTGATGITANGAVTGTGGYGILAYNGATALGGLTIGAQDVAGGLAGIAVANSGAGETVVTAGDVTATDGTGVGILVTNAVVDPDDFTIFTVDPLVATLDGDPNPAAGGIRVEADSVTGGVGIVVQNLGTGATSITADGPVTVGLTGIGAINGETAGALTIDAKADVTAGLNGIFAQNSGTGDTEIIVSGSVAAGDNGIFAINGATAGAVAVTAADITAGRVGISALNQGPSATSITANGTVEGGDAAIGVVSFGPIAISVNGAALNASGAWRDLAIAAQGGAVMLANNGAITGRVELGDADDTFANDGTWRVTGLNVFGDGNDSLDSLAGSAILAAGAASLAEVTHFEGLESFATSGLVSLADGGLGDRIETDGDASFQDGAVYAVDVGGSVDQSDVFIAQGVIDIQEGTTLAIELGAGPLSRGARYAIMHGAGGVDGEFETLTGGRSTAFFTVDDAYDPNNVYVEVVQYRDFSDAALTFNQTQTAGGLDSLTDGALVDVVGNLATDGEARNAFDQLSGEAHASVAGMLLEDSRFVRDTATDRIRAAFAGAQGVIEQGDGPGPYVADDGTGLALWAHGYGSWGGWVTDGNAASVDRSVSGLLIGGDAPLGDAVRIGAFAGYGRHSFDIDARASEGETDDIHLGLYGGAQFGGLTLSAGAAHSWHGVETRRTVQIGNFADTLSADYDATTFQAFGEASYRFGSETVGIEPFANIAYVRVKTDGFVEQGGIAALSSPGFSNDATFSTLGLRVSTAFMLGSVEAEASGMVGWRHAFGDDAPLAVNAFAGGADFLVAGPPVAGDAAVVEAGLDVKFTKQARFGVSYSGAFGSGLSDHGVRARLGVEF